MFRLFVISFYHHTTLLYMMHKKRVRKECQKDRQYNIQPGSKILHSLLFLRVGANRQQPIQTVGFHLNFFQAAYWLTATLLCFSELFLILYGNLKITIYTLNISSLLNYNNEINN